MIHLDTTKPVRLTKQTLNDYGGNKKDRFKIVSIDIDSDNGSVSDIYILCVAMANVSKSSRKIYGTCFGATENDPVYSFNYYEIENVQ